MDTNSFLYLLAGLGTINGFVFGLYLLFAKIGKRKANVFLGIFLILVSIRFLRSIHFFFAGPETVIFYIGHTAFLLAIPFLYFYFKASFSDDFSLNLKHAIHLLPLTALLINSFNYKNLISFVFLLIYTLLSHRELINFSNQLKSSHIKLRVHNYFWYRNLLYIIYINTLIYIFNLVFRFVPYIFGAVAYSFIFYLMLFYWNRYQQYYKQRKILKKYTSSGLAEDEAEKYKTLLFEKISNDKLYTDPTLTLKKLAELLSIPYYQLSQIINQKMEKNFTDFINEYRIEEAKGLLANPTYRDEKIEGIAYDSGFNTPSSFYAAFKKFTGSTPTQYRKKAISN